MLGGLCVAGWLGIHSRGNRLDFAGNFYDKLASVVISTGVVTCGSSSQ